jgi:hypothetical protein
VRELRVYQQAAAHGDLFLTGAPRPELVEAAEAPREGVEEVLQFVLPVGVPPGTQDGHGLTAGPERAARRRIAVVEGELSLVQRGLDPAQKVVAVGHGVSMPLAATTGVSSTSI